MLCVSQHEFWITGYTKQSWMWILDKNWMFRMFCKSQTYMFMLDVGSVGKIILYYNVYTLFKKTNCKQIANKSLEFSFPLVFLKMLWVTQQDLPIKIIIKTKLFFTNDFYKNTWF